MDDLTLVEKWLAGLLAAGGVVVAWAKGEARRAAISDKLAARVEATEKDIRVLKEAHDQRLHDIQSDINRMQADIEVKLTAIWNRTEERHNRLDSKLDRLLERGNGK